MSLRSTIEGTSGKPVLVLANSLAATSAMWNAQCADWGQRWQIFRFDYAGHSAAEAALEAKFPTTMEAIANDGTDDHGRSATAEDQTFTAQRAQSG